MQWQPAIKYTYWEWLRNGYRIKKGQRNIGHNKYNEPLFTLAQVEEDPYHNNPATEKGQPHA